MEKISYGIDLSSHRMIFYKNKRCNLSNLTYDELIQLAWEIGVSNQIGFSKNDTDMWGIFLKKGYKMFKNFWGDTTEEQLREHIWNRLIEINHLKHN